MGGWSNDNRDRIFWDGNIATTENPKAPDDLVKKSWTGFFATGDIKYSLNVAQEGWIPCFSYNTIGKVGSGATYEGEEYHALYNLLNSLLGGGDWDGLIPLFLPEGEERFILGTNPEHFSLGGIGGSMTTNLTSTNQLPRIAGEPEPGYLTTPISISNQQVNTDGITNVVKTFTTGIVKGTAADINVENAYLRAIPLIKL
jgi:hypothetical protein